LYREGRRFLILETSIAAISRWLRELEDIQVLRAADLITT
jgi:hypothetical protein